jgi:hypothetical protein
LRPRSTASRRAVASPPGISAATNGTPPASCRCRTGRPSRCGR